MDDFCDVCSYPHADHDEYTGCGYLDDPWYEDEDDYRAESY